ncbi:uncharacterized protein LOC122054917 [Zingiber officinale]|uniref:uncharacterized protein LOC122054917 n=1 Tax=Zingiber officinale TaxID=94328 RepID=UPI001C4CA20D|nr:uncharacterized protein LOC122054917 [Zingiber officinale]
MKHEDMVYALLPYKSNEIDLDSDLPTEVQQLLSNFVDLMVEDLPLGLPPMREIQHQIDLILGSSVPNRLTYNLSPKDAEELQRQVVELLQLGYIRKSMRPCVVPALLVPNKDGLWCMCINSRAITTITVKYIFPIPRLDDMLDQLSSSKIFSKIDLRSGYHQIQIKLGDKWKIAFKKQHGLYEWMNFSILIALITEYLKGHGFKWTEAATTSFQLVKEKMTEAPVLELPEFTFTLKHQSRSLNYVADALSCHSLLLTTMSIKFVSFGSFLDIQCIINELHNEGHFDQDKTLALISFDFYWTKLTRDAAHFMDRSFVCQQSKGTLTNADSI